MYFCPFNELHDNKHSHTICDLKKCNRQSLKKKCRLKSDFMLNQQIVQIKKSISVHFTHYSDVKSYHSLYFRALHISIEIVLFSCHLQLAMLK